jgi:hypothetical protein
MVSFRKFLAFMACALSFVLLHSCNDPDVLGLNLQSESDQLGVNRIDTLQLYAFVKPEDSLITSRVDQPIFWGNFNEPGTYGSTYAGFAMQVRLGNTITSTTFNGLTGVDSIVLTFAWKTVQGDTDAVHHLSVYELTDLLNSDSLYYSHRPVNKSNLLGHKDFVPNLDDSVVVGGVKKAPQMRVALDSAFGGRLLRDYLANPTNFSSQAAFQSYFKGIVLVDSADGAGSVITLEPTSNFNRLTVYYGGNASYDFVMDNNSPRFSYFRHNYNADLTDSLPDNRLVIQSMAGLKAKLYIPYLKELKNKYGNIAINNAQIIFKLNAASQVGGYNPHDNLLMFASNASGKNSLLIDATESALYYGGSYNSTTQEYKFNIGRYVQRVLTGTDDYGLYLVAGGSTSNARRTLLEGATGIRFIITYTQVNP